MFLHSVPHDRNRPTSRNPFKLLHKYVGTQSARGHAPTCSKTSRSTMHRTSNTYANGAAETLQKGTLHACTPNRETTSKIDPKSPGRPVRPRPRYSPRERPDSDRGHRPDRRSDPSVSARAPFYPPASLPVPPRRERSAPSVPGLVVGGVPCPESVASPFFPHPILFLLRSSL